MARPQTEPGQNEGDSCRQVLTNKSFLYNDHKPVLSLSKKALSYKIMQVHIVINVRLDHI